MCVIALLRQACYERSKVSVRVATSKGLIYTNEKLRASLDNDDDDRHRPLLFKYIEYRIVVLCIFCGDICRAGDLHVVRSKGGRPDAGKMESSCFHNNLLYGRNSLLCISELSVGFVLFS